MRELINAQPTAVRIACEGMTAPHLKALRDSVDRACGVPAALGWDSKARTHAEIFSVSSRPGRTIRSRPWCSAWEPGSPTTS
jgi:hypothetical protein